MNIQRGDVLWMDLQNPPGGMGREQANVRPTVVISLGSLDGNNPMITVVPLTSVLQSQRFPHTSQIIDPTNQNGLIQQSIALAFQVRSLDKNRIMRKVGHLEANHMAQIEALLRRLLSL